MAFDLKTYIRQKQKDQDSGQQAEATPSTQSVGGGGASGGFDLRSYVKRRDISAGKLQKQDQDYISLMDELSGFSTRMGKDYTQRRGSYQSADAFQAYRSKTDQEIADLLARGERALDYYKTWGADYDKAYGEGRSQSILEGLDQGMTYLEKVRGALGKEGDYWGSYADEGAWLRGSKRLVDNWELQSGGDEGEDIDKGLERTRRLVEDGQRELEMLEATYILDPTEEHASAYKDAYARFQGDLEGYNTYASRSKKYYTPEMIQGRIDKLNAQLAEMQLELEEKAERARITGGSVVSYPGQGIQEDTGYDEAKAAYDAVAEKDREIRSKIRAEEKHKTFQEKFAHVIGMPDFDELAKPGESRGNYGKFQVGTFDDAFLYDFINDLGAARSQVGFTDDDGRYWLYSSGSVRGSSYQKYLYMTPDEVMLYNAIDKVDGAAAAKEYLDYITEELNWRQGVDNYQEMPWLGKATYWLPAGLDQFAGGVAQLFSEEALPTSPVQVTSSMVREEAHDTSPVLGFAYDLGTTSANMAPSVLTSMAVGLINPAAGAVTGDILMGASAAGNAYNQKVKEGYSKDQARTYAVLVGASEACLQYLLGGVGQLGGVSETQLLSKIAQIDNGFARFALTMGVHGLSEGMEEGLQEILEPAFASIIFGEDYEVDPGDVIYSALMGFAMGDVFALPGGVGAQVRDSRTGKAYQAMGGDVDTLVDQGLKQAPGSEVYQQALAAQRKMEGGRALSNGDVGRLYQSGMGAVESELYAAAVLADAQETYVRKGSVGQDVVDTILENPAARAQIAQETGIELEEGMSKGRATRAVNEALDMMARGETIRNSDEARVRQLEREIAELDAQQVERGAADLGMQGQSTVAGMYLEGQNAELYVQGMRELYQAGLDGAELTAVDSEATQSLNEHQRRAAYAAGQVDATANSQTLGNMEGGEELPSVKLERMGERGRAGLEAAVENRRELDGFGDGLTEAGLREGYMDLYLAGLNGAALDAEGLPEMAGPHARRLMKSERRFAYENGRQDAAARVAENKRKAQFATVAGKEKGLVWSQWVDENLSRAEADRIHALAKRLNVRVAFVESIANGRANGQIVEADIRIAQDAQQPAMVVFGHEVGHYLERMAPEEYQTLRRFAEQRHRTEIEGLMELYDQAGMERSYDEILKERVNDDIGKLIADPKAMESFIEANKSNRTLLQKVREALRALWQKLTGKDRQQVRTAEEALAAALKASEAQAEKLEKAGQVQDLANTKDMQGVEYSIGYDINNTPFVTVEEDVLEGVPRNQWAKTVRETLRKRFPKGVIVARSHIKINAKTTGEFSRSGYTRWLRDTAPDIYADKFRSVAQMDEVLLAARDYVGEGLNHPRKDNIKEFARGTVQLRVGDNDYIADVVVGTTKDGSMVLYDLVNILPTKIKERKQSQTEPKSPNGAQLRTSKTTSGTNITHPTEDVNGDFSLKGSEVLEREVSQATEQARQEGLDPAGMEEEIRAAVQRVYEGRSLSEDGELYSYDFLTRLPDMKVTTLPGVDAVRTAEGKVDTRKVVDLGMENARAVGTERDGKIFIQNLYTGRELRLDASSIRHGLNGSMNRLLTNARLGTAIGEVVQNAVPINALTNQAEGVTGTYAMAGYATDSMGREFVAIITVKQRSGKVDGIEVYDVTHAVSGRQKRGERVDTKSQGVYPSTNASMVSIADFLKIVKETHQSVLSDDVLSHFDESKNPAGYYTGKAKFSLKGSEVLEREVSQATEQARQEGLDPTGMEEEIRAAVQRALQSLVEEYGAMKPGESPAREVQVPRKTGKHDKVSQTVRTILEAKATPEVAVPTIEELTARGEFSYQALSDKTAMERAAQTIEHKGWGQSLGDWFQAVKNGVVSKENTAMGWALYNQAVNAGDVTTAVEIIQRMVRHQRNAAQAVQATRILKQLSPEAQLYAAQRSVESLQEEINERYGDEKGPKLVISEELARRLLEAGDQEARDGVLRDIYRDIGRQMPSTFLDKWNAWRYLSMLGNARTHVRNIVGNAGFMPVVAVKDMTATAIERAVYAVSGGKLERSKALVGLGEKGRSLLAAAWGDYAKVQDAAMGGGKYGEFQSANRYIEEGRVVFKSKPGKALEVARKANSKALDVEDMWFSKPHYAYAMAQYCAAKGITAETVRAGDAKALEAARAYAIKEAQKATYRDTNALSQMLGGLGRDLRRSKNLVSRGMGVAVEGILPFRKTPANILARGLEYSPMGLVKGLSYDLWQVHQGNMTGAEAIDNISAGLTGTGLLALGVWLAALGLLRGRGPGDDKERELEKLQGHQDYSLELGDMSITLDWLAPEALPLFVGVNLWETAQEQGGEATMSGVLSAVGMVSDPLLEMSCLQSLNDIFDSVGYASGNDMNPLTSAVVSAATSYLTQGLPTVFGQAERVFETERESTYTSTDAFLTGDMQYFLGKVSGKVPLWEFQQVPYIDAWGRTEETGNLGERAFNNLLNPAYVSEIETSPMEEELLRLYEATGENVFPSRAGKHFRVDGARRDLDAEEYVDYATRKGQTARKVVEALVGDKRYSGLEDGEKAEAVKDAYQYAEQTTRQTVAKDYAPDSWVVKAQQAEKEYKIPVEVYILLRSQTAGLESIRDKNGEAIPNSKGLQIMEVVYAVPGLGDRQRGYLFEALGAGKNIRHYNKALVQEKLGKMRKKK